MGVKRQWKIMKLQEAPMPPELRRQLIADIMKRKKTKVKLYCWEVKDKVIQEAFLSNPRAVKDWYVHNRLWEKEATNKGVLLFEYEITVDELLKHLDEGKITNILCGEIPKSVVGIFPRELHEDLRQKLTKETLQNQA